MILLVCGGRHYGDRKAFFAAMDRIESRIDKIIHGGAPGADTLADEWAKARGIPCQAFPAKWKLLGNRAGPVRNQQMLDEGRPQAVVAFPGDVGTADMIARAEKAGLPVWQPFKPDT